MKLLVDENLSPRTADFLREEGHEVELVRELDLGAEDSEIVKMAEEESRVILTQDKDFAEIYYFSERNVNVVVVEPSTQSVESINSILEEYLPEVEGEGLYILSESGYRTVR